MAVMRPLRAASVVEVDIASVLRTQPRRGVIALDARELGFELRIECQALAVNLGESDLCELSHALLGRLNHVVLKARPDGDVAKLLQIAGDELLIEPGVRARDDLRAQVSSAHVDGDKGAVTCRRGGRFHRR